MAILMVVSWVTYSSWGTKLCPTSLRCKYLTNLAIHMVVSWVTYSSLGVKLNPTRMLCKHSIHLAIYMMSWVNYSSWWAKCKVNQSCL